MAFIAVLVECHESGQRKRCGLKSDEEQQEVTGRYHEVHSEECDQHQFVEFAAANELHFRVGPFERLYQDDKNTYIEYILDGGYSGSGHIHTCEHGIACVPYMGAEPEGSEQGEEHTGDPAEAVLRAARKECVIEKHQKKHNQKAYFLFHC